MIAFLQRQRRLIEALAVAGVAALAFVALHALVEEVHPRDIASAFHALSAWQIAAALALTRSATSC